MSAMGGLAAPVAVPGSVDAHTHGAAAVTPGAATSVNSAPVTAGGASSLSPVTTIDAATGQQISAGGLSGSSFNAPGTSTAPGNSVVIGGGPQGAPATTANTATIGGGAGGGSLANPAISAQPSTLVTPTTNATLPGTLVGGASPVAVVPAAATVIPTTVLGAQQVSGGGLVSTPVANANVGGTLTIAGGLTGSGPDAAVSTTPAAVAAAPGTGAAPVAQPAVTMTTPVAGQQAMPGAPAAVTPAVTMTPGVVPAMPVAAGGAPTYMPPQQSPGQGVQQQPSPVQQTPVQRGRRTRGRRGRRNKDMSARKKILAAVKGELRKGVRESGGEDQGVGKYSRAVLGREHAAAWCAYFASWAWKQAGLKSGPNGNGSGAVRELVDWAQKSDRFKSKNQRPKAGDMIAFGANSHIGIVTKVDKDGTIHTIEGNSSDAVSKRSYEAGASNIMGFISAD